jgi:hypothetical protein
MKRIIMIAALLFTSIAAVKAQEVVYDANAEVRPAGKFSAIEVSGTISLYLSQGNETAVAVSAGEEKYNNKIKTEVKNGVLKISVDAGVWNGFSWSNRKLKAYVSVPEVNRLDVSGASYINISGSLKASSLNLSVSGASEIKGDVQLKSLKADLSGASVIRLTGTAENASIDASGAARANIFELKVDNGNVEASGASHIAITVNKELNASASGGSSIQYKGDAVAKTTNASAGASIKNKN